MLACINGEARLMTDNDTDLPASGTPPMDAHGHAALLLVESLVHGLCEKAVLSTREAINITERAASVQLDFSDAATASDASMRHAHSLLLAIAASLQIDQPVEPRAQA